MEKTKHNSRWEKLKKVIAVIKSNYVFFATLPVIVGGALQSFSLFTIGPKFLRFFSTTQMLKDGLIFLSLFAPIVVWVIIVYIFFDIHTKKSGGYILLGLLGYLLITLLFPRDLPYELPISYIITFYSSVFLTLVVVILMSFSLIFQPKIDFLKVIPFLLIIISVGLSYSFYFKLTNDFSYAKIDKLGNYANVECYLEEQSYYTEEHKIEYFNDEFIFIRFIKGKKHEIRIIPFEVMLDDSYCE